MTSFTETVIQIIKQIPPGKVMTYGQIAKLTGSPRASRQVVWIIHSMSEKHGLPWQRVVNSKGMIALTDVEGATMQRLMLQAEGVELTKDGLIDLEKYLFIS